MKVSFSPNIIHCGWLGLKHQPTNCFSVCVPIPLPSEVLPPATFARFFSHLNEGQLILYWNCFLCDLSRRCSSIVSMCQQVDVVALPTWLWWMHARWNRVTVDVWGICRCVPCHASDDKQWLLFSLACWLYFGVFPPHSSLLPFDRRKRKANEVKVIDKCTCVFVVNQIIEIKRVLTMSERSYMVCFDTPKEVYSVYILFTPWQKRRSIACWLPADGCWMFSFFSFFLSFFVFGGGGGWTGWLGLLCLSLFFSLFFFFFLGGGWPTVISLYHISYSVHLSSRCSKSDRYQRLRSLTIRLI